MTEKVVLVFSCVDVNDNISAEVEEFCVLAKSAGADVIGIIKGKLEAPNIRFFIGTGKVEEVRQFVATHTADLVIFNHTLSPSQERNLERYLHCRVIDRTELILDIFAKRARTFEGKLQVELAQLQHLATRLVKGWTHLERQRGGIGLKGPGETQLETDRRVLRKKVTALNERLTKVRMQRMQGRRARHKARLVTVAFVGYTNAGKSSLFNRLTSASVYVADKLFATLDPTLRKINLPNFGTVILADTVGFIRNLPHELVAAFKATLEETRDADLILHVVDASDPEHLQKIAVVNSVLQEIRADKIPQVLVYNKIDLLTAVAPRLDYDYQVDSFHSMLPRCEEQETESCALVNKDLHVISSNTLPKTVEFGKEPNKCFRVWLSAKTGDGIENLILVLQKVLAFDLEEIQLCLLPKAGQMRSYLYKIGAVLSEEIDYKGNFHLKVRARRSELAKML